MPSIDVPLISPMARFSRVPHHHPHPMLPGLRLKQNQPSGQAPLGETRQQPRCQVWLNAPRASAKAPPGARSWPAPDFFRHCRDNLKDSDMSAYKSDFLNILNERGFIHQCSDFDGLDAWLARERRVGYIGYDCTTRSLHIGNYLTMMMLYWLQQSGNKPIALMGGGTTMVGDPSGKDETRACARSRKSRPTRRRSSTVFSRVLEFGDGAHDAIMVDNADWLLKLGYIEMLRDVGRHFSVNRMLSMDSVRPQA
jgi:hypothetical protein